MNNEFVDDYINLIIKQYYYKPKARAEISAMIKSWGKIHGFFNDFFTAFDLDHAVGEQLDIIGRIIGMPRSVPLIVQKVAFGFDDNINARTFADKFDNAVISAPFLDKFSPNYTDQQLNDHEFRFFIKCKIAKNAASAYLISDEKESIQSLVSWAFDGFAYVTDNYDMSLTLHISPNIEKELVSIVSALNLLPKPQAVRYKYSIVTEPFETFGFSDNTTAKGFTDKFNINEYIFFAEKVL